MGENIVSRCRVLVANDYMEKGGAEEVYRQSVELLRAMPEVDVECFDFRRLSASAQIAPQPWNRDAARTLAETIATFRPHRVLMHNYHNILSASVLGVLARCKREFGYTAYLTCHDYHIVHYNPTLLHYANGRVDTLALDALRTQRAFWSRASAKGHVHDALKKIYWHTMQALNNPANVFDMFLCPSPFMQQALNRSGIRHTVLLPNPAAIAGPPCAPRVCTEERLNLAFVGRVAAEKGLAPFIELAQNTGFARIERITVYGDGPERAAIEQRFAALIDYGKVVFRGRLPQRQLFEALQHSAHALVLPSLCAENAPLAIIEAAMLGLPALVHDVGSLSTFGDDVGNKIRFTGERHGFRRALDELAAHLADPHRHYDVSAYTTQRYATRLAQIMRIGEQIARQVPHAAAAAAPANGGPVAAAVARALE